MFLALCAHGTLVLRFWPGARKRTEFVFFRFVCAFLVSIFFSFFFSSFFSLATECFILWCMICTHRQPASHPTIQPIKQPSANGSQPYLEIFRKTFINEYWLYHHYERIFWIIFDFVALRFTRKIHRIAFALFYFMTNRLKSRPAPSPFLPSTIAWRNICYTPTGEKERRRMDLLNEFCVRVGVFITIWDHSNVDNYLFT